MLASYPKGQWLAISKVYMMPLTNPFIEYGICAQKNSMAPIPINITETRQKKSGMKNHL